MSKVIVNCQFAGIKNAGGAGRYVSEIVERASVYTDLKIQFVNSVQGGSKEHSSIVKMGKEILSRVASPALYSRIKNCYMLRTTGSVDFKEDMGEGSVLLHEISSYSLYQGIDSLMKKKNFKLVATFLDIQDYFYPEFFSDRILKVRRDSYAFLRDTSSRHIAISSFTKKTMVEHLGIPESAIDVIHLAADTDEPSDDPIFESRISELGRYVVYPSKLWKHKNHDFLLRSVSRLRAEFCKAKMKVVLCGGFSQEDIDYILDMSRKLRIEKLVVCLGYLEANQVKILVSKADYLIFPSLFEGFGMPVIEAMALGCPVISSQSASLPEVCGEAALFFNATLDDSIDSVLIDIMRGSVDRDVLVQKGYVNAMMYSWEKCVKQTTALYEKVLRYE